MLNCKLTLFFIFRLISLEIVDSVNINALVQKANLYYQQPLQDGTRSEVLLNRINSLSSKTDLKVIIHGFIGNRFHYSIRPVGQAYMAEGKDNVFLVDWRDAANLDYYSSRKAVGIVGRHLGRMLDQFLKKLEILPSEVHIIGHSLGAHIAGNIGLYFNGTLGRVTGLDPALPLFLPSSPDSLHPNAATFVDIIHTDYPVFGDITPRGDVDFYPNYGYAPQRGCESVDLLAANSCSHNRAVNLYAESIGLPKNFPALACPSLTAIKMRSFHTCLTNATTSGVRDIESDDETGVVYMGEYVSRSATGIFYLSTYGAPPFGMGLYNQMTG